MNVRAPHRGEFPVPLVSILFALTFGALAAPPPSGAGTGDIPQAPPAFALESAYPDTFCAARGGATDIRFSLPRVARVWLQVLDASMSNVVRTLRLAELQPGLHQVTWNGSDDLGVPLADGRYPYQLVALDTTATADTLFRDTKVITLDCSGTAAVGPRTGGVRIALSPGHPNPFRERVRFLIRTERSGRLAVRILDIAGRPVRTLMDTDRPSGELSLEWNGCDEAGRRVPAGVYHCVLRSGAVIQSARVTRLRQARSVATGDAGQGTRTVRAPAGAESPQLD